MWRVVWLLGEPATGKTTLLRSFVAGAGGGNGVVHTTQHGAQRYVFSGVGPPEARVFVVGRASSYAGTANQRPGLESGSSAYKAAFHLGVAALLETYPAGTLVLDLVAYPKTGFAALDRLARVHALRMPEVPERELRDRYAERKAADPAYYSKTFERNREMVTRTLDKVREWLGAHATSEQPTADAALAALRAATFVS